MALQEKPSPYSGRPLEADHQGGEMAILTLSLTCNTQFWEIMGRILAYTIAVLGQFPLTCICQVVCRGLFGLQCGEDENVLVTDFLATPR